LVAEITDAWARRPVRGVGSAAGDPPRRRNALGDGQQRAVSARRSSRTACGPTSGRLLCAPSPSGIAAPGPGRAHRRWPIPIGRPAGPIGRRHIRAAPGRRVSGNWPPGQRHLDARLTRT